MASNKISERTIRRLPTFIGALEATIVRTLIENWRPPSAEPGSSRWLLFVHESQGGNRPRHAEPYPVVPDFGFDRVAVRCAEVLRTLVPGAAAQNVPFAIHRSLRRPIFWCVLIIGPAILRPRRSIPHHVINAP